MSTLRIQEKAFNNSYLIENIVAGTAENFAGIRHSLKGISKLCLTKLRANELAAVFLNEVCISNDYGSKID